ncbi:MAG TPA: hypothetical protein V6D08_10015 [Candidatus Obscuribacterales bacterium]
MAWQQVSPTIRLFRLLPRPGSAGRRRPLFPAAMLASPRIATGRLLAASLAIVAAAPLPATLAAGHDSQPPSQSGSQRPSGSVLKGRISATQSPFLSGTVETIPEGTQVNLTLTANLNSELSQKGDEVLARIAVEVKDGQKVLLPAGWYAHGFVTDVASQRRLGRDGYVEVEFDSIISPDGNYELSFPAKLSTKDNKLKSAAKLLAKDAGYVAVGAAAGAILSAQITGIPLAVMTQGYSVAVGAGVGAGVGAFAALKRKGKIASFYPGDELKLTIAEPLTIPAFNPEALAASPPAGGVEGLNILVARARFGKDPFGDERSRLLTLDVKLDNESSKEYSFFDLAVVSDHNQRYYPSILGGLAVLKKKVPPHTSQEGTLTFSVDSPKRKYWIVLLDRVERKELARVPIN